MSVSSKCASDVFHVMIHIRLMLSFDMNYCVCLQEQITAPTL